MEQTDSAVSEGIRRELTVCFLESFSSPLVLQRLYEESRCIVTCAVETL